MVTVSVSDPLALDAVTVIVSTPCPAEDGEMLIEADQLAAGVMVPLAPEGLADHDIDVGVFVQEPVIVIEPIATVRVYGMAAMVTTGGEPAIVATAVR